MSRIETTRTARLPWIEILKSLVPPVVWHFLYRKLVIKNIPAAECYRPHYLPWLSAEFFARFSAVRPFTLVSSAGCWTLSQMLAQALHVEGDVAEAGVFRGGTARLLKQVMQDSAARKSLFLFDSFQGMQRIDGETDRHVEGDFSDTSLEAVRKIVGSETFIEYRKGWIPESFTGLEDRCFCFVHIDLDLYQGILDCLNFIYPRLSQGGCIVFDDYGFASCPGARKAVDEFFADKPERPLALMTGQALVSKL